VYVARAAAAGPGGSLASDHSVSVNFGSWLNKQFFLMSQQDFGESVLDGRCFPTDRRISNTAYPTLYGTDNWDSVAKGQINAADPSSAGLRLILHVLLEGCHAARAWKISRHTQGAPAHTQKGQPATTEAKHFPAVQPMN
jgi:hypothetical protein